MPFAGAGPALRVDVTPRAARTVRDLVARRDDATGPDAPRFALRIVTAPPGAPQPYRLSLLPTPPEGHVVLPRNGFDVAVPLDEAAEVDGVRVDYLDSGTGHGFVVDDPARAADLPPVADAPAATGDPELFAAVDAALEAVRPVLQSEGGDVDLVAVDDGTAYLRLEGACSGCSAALVTLTHIIESAVVDAVPQIERTVLVA